MLFLSLSQSLFFLSNIAASSVVFVYNLSIEHHMRRSSASGVAPLGQRLHLRESYRKSKSKLSQTFVVSIQARIVNCNLLYENLSNSLAPAHSVHVRNSLLYSLRFLSCSCCVTQSIQRGAPLAANFGSVTVNPWLMCCVYASESIVCRGQCQRNVSGPGTRAWVVKMSGQGSFKGIEVLYRYRRYLGI